MRVLNLANPSKGNIEFSVLSFPDGQKLINLGGVYAKGNTNIESTVQIVSRMSWQDVQTIVCATKALREAGFKHIHLYVPYFLGARSDRKFQAGSVNYLKEVICPIINSMEFDSVTVLDPHSNCLEMGLKNFKKLPQDALIEYVFKHVYGEKHVANYTLVCPDKGAYDRVAAAAKLLNTESVIVCDKHRNILTGEIISIEVPNEGKVYYDMAGKDIFVIDDICDGGGTFIPIAKECKERGAARVFLVVSHGIFSKGLKVLTPHFDGIYTTNSFIDYSGEFSMFNDRHMHKLNVLNVI